MNDNRKITEASVCTLGNAADVVARVILNIAGNDISTKLSGTNMTMNSVKELALARFNLNLSKKA
jgi:ribosomal protein S5